MDMKYDKMIALNREDSKQKVQKAKDAILEMFQGMEKISVAVLVERTGLSRGLFYKNAQVRAELDKAIYEQRGQQNKLKIPQRKRKVPKQQVKEVPGVVEIMLQNEEKSEKIKELEKSNEQLQKEIAALQNRLAKKEISFLKKI